MTIDPTSSEPPSATPTGWTDLDSPRRDESIDPALDPAIEPAIEPAIDPAVEPQGMIRGRARRRSGFERVSMRILATGGIIGLAVALGAILVANQVDGWIVGLVVGLTSVTLAAILWSSRQL